MPKTGKNDHARKDELPSTLQRSDRKAQDTFAKTYDSAMESYHDESRAARAAYASLKHSYEKVGDHWEAKGKRGPSDQRAEQHGPRSSAPTAVGVDANASKEHLYNLAKRMDVKGRSKMDKSELVEALQKANDSATRKARS